jgi:uncharacterized protein YcnI
LSSVSRRLRRAALLALAALAGILPAGALAHGTILPTSAQRGATQNFVVVIPNISVNVPMTGFRLTPPAGLTVEPEADPGWSITTEGRTVVWTGAGVSGGQEGRFNFRAQLPDSGADVTFQAEESYPSVPRSGSFPLRVALTDTAAAEPSSGTRTLVIALIGGGVLALAILAALLLPRLRRP